MMGHFWHRLSAPNFKLDNDIAPRLLHKCDANRKARSDRAAMTSSVVESTSDLIVRVSEALTSDSEPLCVMSRGRHDMRVFDNTLYNSNLARTGRLHKVVMPILNPPHSEKDNAQAQSYAGAIKPNPMQKW
jgi:hypothetical protein